MNERDGVSLLEDDLRSKELLPNEELRSDDLRSVATRSVDDEELNPLCPTVVRVLLGITMPSILTGRTALG